MDLFLRKMPLTEERLLRETKLGGFCPNWSTYKRQFINYSVMISHLNELRDTIGIRYSWMIDLSMLKLAVEYIIITDGFLNEPSECRKSAPLEHLT
jgi:hypothetical protein